MALSDVGLNYVSNNAAQFIKDADNATNSVTRLNFGLSNTRNSNGWNKNLGLLSSGTKLLTKNVEDNNEALGNNVKILGSVTTVTTQASSVLSKLQNNIKPLPPFVVKSAKALEQFNSVMVTSEQPRQNYLGWVNTLIKTFLKIPKPVLIASAAIAGFKIASFIVEKFGERAAGLTAVADSFEKLRQNAGLATDWIDKFAESADNQLTQSELLILSNKALAGSYGEFQSELASSLPTLLEFARVRAAATGEDSGFLFQSLIEGIKKQEPEILDNLGLVVKLDEVYKTYAQTLGTTTENLTAVQKQQAILNRVNSEAARNIGILGEATLSNADKLEARSNIYSDIADKISLSIQPLLGVFLDIEIFFARLIGQILSPVISIIQSIFSVLSSAVTFVFNQIKPAFEFFTELVVAVISPFEALFRVMAKLAPIVFELWSWFSPLGLAIKAVNLIFRSLTPLLQGVTFLFQTIGDLLIGLINFLQFLGNVIGNVINTALAPFLNWINSWGFSLENIKTIITNLASVIAFGFGKAVAFLVNVFAGAAKNILTIVADLAQGIADFLIGESPPPKGPLSKIDEGGKATFEAWLDGFTSLSLKPVEQVAGEVNATLGNIGSLSLPQVEGRIRKLDKALRPFKEQLEIVQSRFEAIQGPAEAALSAIDRQLDKAIEVLTKGDETAKEAVQALDAQRAAIFKNLELQQQQVDFAQIQLALKQAQQSEERALLEIQKKRLSGQKLSSKELQKEKAILDKTPQTQEKQASSGSGGSQAATSPTTGVTPSATGGQFGDLALLGFQDELDLTNFEAIGEQQDRLVEQGGRIGQGLAGLPDRFGEAFGEIFGPEGTISTLINDIFGAEGFFVTSITNLFSDTGFLKTTFNNIFGAEGYLWGLWSGIFGENGFFVTQFNNLFGESGIIGLTLGAWFGMGGFLSTQLDAGSDLFEGMYNAVFGDTGIFSGVAPALESLIRTPLLTVLTGLEILINSFISYAESFLNGIIDSVEGLVEYIPTELRGSLNDLIGYELVIPRVDFNPPQAAKGGIFSGGMLSVGEKGRELIAPANKIGVFPNNFVTAIESLESVLMQSMNLSGYGNNSSVTNTNNSNSSQVININQPTSMQTVRQQLSLVG